MTHALPRSTPERQGVASTGVAEFIRALDREAHDVHSVMVLRHGNVIAEGWWNPYRATDPHMLYSLSKSFTATAIGIACFEGLLSIDDVVVSLLPDDAPTVVSDNLAALRVRHLLTMTTGHAVDTMPPHTATEHNWARSILSQPIVSMPGTEFVYDSGATYLLAAILHKLTGERLLDYLTPRLLTPLGIVGATWESCPRGIDVGGWGLSITTEDIARFGQLYLQHGRWGDHQVVPAEWVHESTAFRVPNGDPTLPDDHTQGYGYQFWRCRHNSYRANGAFGQLCIVMPEQDAVVVLTCGLPESATALDLVWTHLLPALDGDPGANTYLGAGPGAALGAEPDGLLSAGPDGALGAGPDAALSAGPDAALGAGPNASLAFLTELALRHPSGVATSATAARTSDVRVELEPNEARLDAVAVTARDGRTALTLWSAGREHRLECGFREWIRGAAPFTGGDAAPVALSGAWTDENTFAATMHFSETPYSRTVTVRLHDETMTVDITQNVSFGETDVAHGVVRLTR